MFIAILYLIVLCLLFPGLMRLAAVLVLFGFFYLVAQATATPVVRTSDMHDALAYCRSPDVDPRDAMDGKRMLTDKECARRFLKNMNPAVSPSSDRKCLGHVNYMDDGVRKSENFEITAMRINQKTGATLFAGHGTDWYAPNEIKITGHCNYVPQHTPIDSQGDKYYETR
jgi:hypothetical protein